MSAPDRYLPVPEACKRFGFSRSTFYRLLASNPELEDHGTIVRVPPVTGRIKVPAARFERWLIEQNGGQRHGEAEAG